MKIWVCMNIISIIEFNRTSLIVMGERLGERERDREAGEGRE